MMSFSLRYGYEPALVVQYESINADLLNSILNCLEKIWGELSQQGRLNEILNYCWVNFFKLPLYEFQYMTPHDKMIRVRAKFLEFTWHKVYSFLEFLAPLLERYLFSIDFIDQCNAIFERESSAYRFINGLITPITSEHEIASIIIALDKKDEPALHIESALTLLSNREKNQARESIAQSISAVEAIAKKVTGKNGATLSDLLGKKKLHPIHPQLQTGFNNLYNFTSGKDGIRHALTTESSHISKALAMYMLVTCSAFVNLIRDEFKSETIPDEAQTAVS